MVSKRVMDQYTVIGLACSFIAMKVLLIMSTFCQMEYCAGGIDGNRGPLQQTANTGKRVVLLLVFLLLLLVKQVNMTDSNENDDIVNLHVVDALLTAAQHQSLKPTVAKQDLSLVSQWAKFDLFEKVKFLYNQDKDLEVGGMLYKLFVNDCKDRLVGLKGTVGEYRKIYVELLWQEANKKKCNLVANGLTTRRSSVYATMQHRFVGK